MNKNVKDGIIRGNALVEKPSNVLSGNVNGFYTVISFEEKKVATIRLNAKTAEFTPVVSMESYFEELKGQNKRVIDCTYTDSYIEIHVQLPMGNGKTIELINGITDQTIHYLAVNGYQSGCAFCGSNEVPLSLNNFLGTIVVCCDECTAEHAETIKERQNEFKESKGNYVAGLVGGLLGSLIGFAVYFLVYQLGYIAVISGVVMSICVLKGFELLGGKLNVLGAASCLVIAVGMACVATRFACAYEITDIVNSGLGVSYNVFDYFRNLEQALDLFEGGLSDYYMDLAYGCGSTLIVGIMYAVNMHKDRAFKGVVTRY